MALVPGETAAPHVAQLARAARPLGAGYACPADEIAAILDRCLARCLPGSEASPPYMTPEHVFHHEAPRPKRRERKA